LSEGWLDLGAAGDFPPDRHTVVAAGGSRYVVVNLGGEFSAFTDRCTHDGVSFEWGELEGESLMCPRHGARFCARTGRPQTAPARRPLQALAVRIADGRLLGREPGGT
jgi:3-phenylpropionate/trans-cinnamate dioxygenase ferredoxin subunit